jgi:molecular chaperone GrpE
MSDEREKQSESRETEVVEAEVIEEDNQERVEFEDLEQLGDQVQEDIEGLKQSLEESRLKSEEYLEGWQRARAEFANFRKRVDRDRVQAQQTAAASIIRRYLEIVDDLERALKNRPKEGEGAVWAGGIELIYRKFLKILESEGVKPMQAEDEEFDPNLHEAITHEDSPEHESGQVIEVVQTGYMIGDKVLRPALVRVAR